MVNVFKELIIAQSIFMLKFHKNAQTNRFVLRVFIKINIVNVFKELIIAQSVLMVKFHKNAQNKPVRFARFY
jgi:menaquinone-dependent protoporphyrinogen IX oxidase